MISTIAMFGLTINIICSFKYLCTAHNILSCLAFAVTFLPVALLLIQAIIHSRQGSVIYLVATKYSTSYEQ